MPGVPREERGFQPDNLKLRRGAESLSRHERLRSSKDFSRIFREGEKVRLKSLTVRWVPNDLPWSRVGTSVGRRFGNAVRRNRARRILRELYRTRKGWFPSGIDMVFMPGKYFLNAGWEQHEKIFAEAARRISGSFTARASKGRCRNE